MGVLTLIKLKRGGEMKKLETKKQISIDIDKIGYINGKKGVGESYKELIKPKLPRTKNTGQYSGQNIGHLNHISYVFTQIKYGSFSSAPMYIGADPYFMNHKIWRTSI